MKFINFKVIMEKKLVKKQLYVFLASIKYVALCFLLVIFLFLLEYPNAMLSKNIAYKSQITVFQEH